MVPGEKKEKWGSGEQNEIEGKRGKEKGERKEKKRKRGRVIFLLIYGILLLIIVYINVTFHDPLRGILAAGEKYKNWGFGEKIRRGKTILLFSFSPTPHFFPQQSFTCFPTTIVFFPRIFYGCGEAGKGLLGKKGGGENEKGENGFPPSYFFPKSSVFIFFPQQPVFPLMDYGENGFPHS